MLTSSSNSPNCYTRRILARCNIFRPCVDPYDFAKSGAPESFAYCHMNLIARRGIYNFENLDLDELSADKAYEFLFSWAPLKLVGATGSPGNPVAAY